MSGDNHARLFREVADGIDALDDEAKNLQEERRLIWKSARAELSPLDVKALKDAIRQRRIHGDAEKAAEAEALDLRASQILVLIELKETSRVVGHARARDIEAMAEAGADVYVAPPHDPDTGELTEPVAVTIAPVTVAETGKLLTPVSALSDQGAGDIPEMPDFLRRVPSRSETDWRKPIEGEVKFNG
jgi:uncharacterized protein (UPF0335 family)